MIVSFRSREAGEKSAPPKAQREQILWLRPRMTSRGQWKDFCGTAQQAANGRMSHSVVFVCPLPHPKSSRKATIFRFSSTGTLACAEVSLLSEASTGRSAGATRVWSFPFPTCPSRSSAQDDTRIVCTGTLHDVKRRQSFPSSHLTTRFHLRGWALRGRAERRFGHRSKSMDKPDSRSQSRFRRR
jgi:hypothetical protein